MFELPLLNTVILLSSGATITYAHHSLIAGERKGALYGSIATVILAIIFTLFQGIEYSVSSFTISDGVFGTCFFFGTGFHGLIIRVGLFIYKEGFYLTTLKNIILHNVLFIEAETSSLSGLVLKVNNKKPMVTLPIFKQEECKHCCNDPNSHVTLKKDFLEWFVGFSDGEGNFHIRLTDFKENTYKNAQFTFQIGLHEDDLKVLEYIMNTLKCGHISKSKNRVNFFVNDINSLLYTIIPIFDNINLNSSKYHHFLLFKKAVILTKNKKHLSNEGKLEIIKFKKEMQKLSGKWVPSSINNKINISKHWLAGFIDAEGTFSTSRYVPRFKLENHVRELELYNKIKEFIVVGNLLLTTPRVYKENSNSTVVLEINKIRELRDNLIPLMYDFNENNHILLKSLKSSDFRLWLKLVDIYYKGYHTTLEGKFIFDAIKLHMNKYRLTSNINLLKNTKRISILKIDGLLSKLYLYESPYEIKEGIRYYRNTNKLVSDCTSIIVIDNNKNKTIYKSLSECAKSLNISRAKVKNCLDSGKSYKDYIYIYN